MKHENNTPVVNVVLAYLCNMSMPLRHGHVAVWTHGQYEHSGEKETILPQPKAEPQCLGCPAQNVAPILTTVLANWKKRKVKMECKHEWYLLYHILCLQVLSQIETV
jgi:hypothetical protein